MKILSIKGAIMLDVAAMLGACVVASAHEGAQGEDKQRGYMYHCLALLSLSSQLSSSIYSVTLLFSTACETVTRGARRPPALDGNFPPT